MQSCPTLRLTIVLALILAACSRNKSDRQFAENEIPKIASYRATDQATLLAGFADPPSEAGPWVYWFWYDNAVVEDEVRRELREMKDAGIAGVEIRAVKTIWKSERLKEQEFIKSNHRPLAYLEESFLHVLEAACNEAERLGIKVALNLGMGWPAGGTWIPDRHKSRQLVIQKLQAVGPRQLRGDDRPSIPENSFVLAWKKDPQNAANVLPETFVDLGKHVVGTARNQRLEWDVPAGQWVIGVFGQGYGGKLDKADGFPADPGSQEAILFHLDYLFGRLNPVLQNYYGRTLVEIASDSWEYDGKPYWTPQLPQAFQKKTGTTLFDQMYALLDLGPDRATIKTQLEDAEADLVEETFFHTVTEYLRKLGLRHKSQPYGRGLNRNLFSAYSESDIPEAEQHRLISESVWVGRTLGKPIVSMEAYTFFTQGDEQFEESMESLRLEGLRIYASGINRIQLHSFSYSPAELGVPGWAMYAPIHLNRMVTWWRYLPRLTAWMRRMQWVLQAGEPVADILVYPIPSNPADGPFDQRNPTRYPNSPINMVDGANIETLTHRDFLREGHYRALNVYLTDEIKTQAELVGLERLIESGTRVWTRNPLDTWAAVRGDVPGLDPVWRETLLKHRKAGHIIFNARPWDQVQKELQSVHWKPADGHFQYIHRTLEETEIYVVMNAFNQPGESPAFEGWVSFPHLNVVPHELNPDTGEHSQLGTYRFVDGRLEIPLRLAPGEARILMLVPAEPPNHVVKTNLPAIEATSEKTVIAQVRSSGRYQAQLANGQLWQANVDVPNPFPINGAWILGATPQDGLGLPDTFKQERRNLIPWQEIPELETFAGTVHYEIDFQVPARFIHESDRVDIELGRVWTQGEVFVNGKNAGVAWYAPYRVDVSGLLRTGTNRLRVDVTNVLKNFKLPYAEEQDVDKPTTVKHAMGLLGPVRLVSSKTVIIDPSTSSRGRTQ